MAAEPRHGILVVDDNEAARYARSRALRQAGFQVVESGTGRDALAIAIRDLPGLIVLDVNLPDMHGFEVCETLKSNPATAPIPILHMSATSVSVPDQVKGLGGGADAYLTDPTSPEVLVATVRALLRIRHAEEAVRESHQRFELVAQATRDSIWDYNPVTGGVWWSESVNPVFGHGALGARVGLEEWSGLIHPEDRHPALDRLEACLRSSGAGCQDEFRMLRGDGHYAYVLSRCQILRDAGGRAIRVIGALTDVTAQKATERALRASEARLRLALEVASLGTWDYDPNTGVLVWDQRCKELYGLPADADVDYTRFLEGVHPDDRDRVSRVVRRALDPAGPGELRTEYRAIGFGDGRERHIRSVGRAFFEGGRAVRLVGTVQDVTDRKRAAASQAAPA